MNENIHHGKTPRRDDQDDDDTEKGGPKKWINPGEMYPFWKAVLLGLAVAAATNLGAAVWSLLRHVRVPLTGWWQP